MTRTSTSLIACATLLAGGAFSGLAAQSDAAPPDTVVLEGSPLGTVTFSHAEHQAMTECVVCHHESRPQQPATEPYQACDVCHASQPAPPMTTTLRLAFHDVRGQSGICIDCHKREAEAGNTTVPVRCNTCHIRQR